MNRSETETLRQPSTARRILRRVGYTTLATLGVGGAVFGGNQLLNNSDQERQEVPIGNVTPSPESSEASIPTTSPETEAPQENLEQRATEYKQEALSFVQTSVNKLSDATVETNPQGSENTTYELSNIPTSELTVMEPGQKRKRIIVTLNFGKRTMDVMGVEESRNEGMINQVQTTYELDQDNPVFDANPDAPVTSKDFVTAINGVDIDDVRSIVVFGQGIEGQINGEFVSGKTQFTDGENPRTDIPTRDQIHEVIERVQP